MKRHNKKSFASKVANVVENANRSLISELTNNRGALTIQYKTGAVIKGNTDSKKVIIDFGSHKDKYDELPSGRKYLTPEEIVAIQDLEFEDNCPLRIVRDAFTLSCLYGGRAADYLDKNTNWEAYYHCVGALLILAGIVKQFLVSLVEISMNYTTIRFMRIRFWLVTPMRLTATITLMCMQDLQMRNV